MNKKQTLSLIAFSAILSLVGFQNCSKVGVQDNGVVSDKLAGNGVGTNSDELGNPGDSGSGTITQPTDPTGGNPGGAMDPGQPGSDSQNPPVKNPPVVNNPPDVNTPPVTTMPAPGDRSELIANCLLESKGLSLVGPEIIDINGSIDIHSNYLTRVEVIGGNVRIRGKGEGASAKYLHDIHGNLMICGMDVDTIDGIGGKLVLVNSKVKHIKSVGGNITVLNSEVGSIEDSHGNIREVK